MNGDSRIFSRFVTSWLLILKRVAGEDFFDIGQIELKRWRLSVLKITVVIGNPFWVLEKVVRMGVTDGGERVDPVTLLEIYIESKGYNG